MSAPAQDCDHKWDDSVQLPAAPGSTTTVTYHHENILPSGQSPVDPPNPNQVHPDPTWEDGKIDEEALAQYYRLVCVFPDFAIDFSDFNLNSSSTPAPQPYPDENYSVEPLLTTLNTTIAVTPVGPVTSAPQSSPRRQRPLIHPCTECDKVYYRPDSARDCAHKDLGEMPYKCEGNCWRNGCSYEIWSEKLFDEHFVQKVQCSNCSEYILKKNLSRHETPCARKRNAAAVPPAYKFKGASTSTATRQRNNASEARRANRPSPY